MCLPDSYFGICQLQADSVNLVIEKVFSDVVWRNEYLPIEFVQLELSTAGSVSLATTM